MKAIRNIIKFILITILTICMISIGIITIVSSTILEKDYITGKLEETEFYTKIYELVKSNFENYIYQSGLDEEVLENICTEEKVKQDINMMLANIYQGTNQKIDTTEIANKLNENIDKLGVKNSKNEKNIEQFVQHICDEYTDTIIHTQYEDKINDIYIKISKILEKIHNTIIIIFVIDIVLLLILNLKKVSKDVQDVGIALFATSIFELVACNIIVSKVKIEGIKIFNDVFSKTIVAIIQEMIDKVVSLGIGTLVIAVIIIAIYGAIVALNENDKNKRRKESTEQ